MGTSGRSSAAPATATVKVGGHSYSFTKGFCAGDIQNHLALQLSLGTDIPSFSGKPNRGLPLLAMTLSTSGKTGTLLTLDVGGRKLVPADTQVAASYKGSAAVKGTFSGRDVTGAWNCHGDIYKLNQG